MREFKLHLTLLNYGTNISNEFFKRTALLFYLIIDKLRTLGLVLSIVQVLKTKVELNLFPPSNF